MPVADIIAAIGGNVLQALVAIRAGIVIASFRFIQIAVQTGNVSKISDEPVKTLFVYITFAFGAGGVVAMIMFFVERIRAH